MDLTGASKQGSLDQSKALDAQLLLRLGNSLYPRVLLLILGLCLGYNLPILLLEVLLGETTCGVSSVSMVHLSAGADSHLVM